MYRSLFLEAATGRLGRARFAVLMTCLTVAAAASLLLFVGGVWLAHGNTSGTIERFNGILTPVDQALLLGLGTAIMLTVWSFFTILAKRSRDIGVRPWAVALIVAIVTVVGPPGSTVVALLVLALVPADVFRTGRPESAPANAPSSDFPPAAPSQRPAPRQPARHPVRPLAPYRAGRRRPGRRPPPPRPSPAQPR